MPGPQRFTERVEALVKQRGRKLSGVLSDAYDESTRGTSSDLFKRVRREEMPPRRPLVEAMAAELDVPPWHFEEWRLLAIRDAVDPRPGLLDQALANAAVIERGASNEELLAMVAATAPGGDALQADQDAAARRLADFSQQELDQDEREHPEAPDADEGSS